MANQNDPYGLEGMFDDEPVPKQPKTPKGVTSKYKEGDYAALADFIINGHRDEQLVPTRDYDNTPCPKCESMTGSGQYIERDGAVVCTHCRTSIHPSYFDADEERALLVRQARADLDAEDLNDILNVQGLKWVITRLFEYANLAGEKRIARDLAHIKNTTYP